MGVRSMVKVPSTAVRAQTKAPGIPRYRATFWIGWRVTESITFPVIVPVIPAAGCPYGISRLSASKPVAAIRMKLEIIGEFPPQGSPQRGGFAESTGLREEVYGRNSLRKSQKPVETTSRQRSLAYARRR